MTSFGRLCALVASLLCAAMLSGCSYFNREAEPFRPSIAEVTAGPDRGGHLYLRDCAWCHGNRGQGTSNGPNIVTGTNGPAALDFMLSTGRMPLDKPTDPMIHRDPAYTTEEIEDIIAFVEGFGTSGESIPALDLEEADLSLGNELYQENCAACHSTTGVGGSLTAGRIVQSENRFSEESGIVAPSLYEASAVETAEAIRVGPGTMPVFSDDTFDQEELNAIVRYVMYLQDPADPGGAGIGRIGPVAEGAVGWIIGLGLLLLLIRWVGTKRGEI
jgi:ubiquinol-cytochrome c reductase cytochrome c subunit